MSKQPTPSLSPSVIDSGSIQSRDYLTAISQLILSVALLVVSVFALALFFFAMPVWDDLIRATRPLELGWWGYMQHVYNRWQGRWASCGLETLVLPRLDISRYYFLLIGAVAGVDFIGVLALCRWLTPRAARKVSFFIALGLLALLWAGMPSLGETVYWFTGAVENAMVYALAALVLIAVDSMSRRNHTRLWQWPIIALLCLATAVVCGFHELYGGMLCLCLGIGTVAAFADPRVDRILWISVTVAAAVGLWIVVRAPGNEVRFATDGGPHAKHFSYDLHVAISEARHFLPRWFLDPKLLAAWVWIAMAPVPGNRPDESPAQAVVRWLAPLAWIIMLAAGFFAPSWAFGAYMPPRTLSGVYIIFVLGGLANVYLWSPQLIRLNPITRMRIASFAILIFAISLVSLGNVPRAAHDFYRRIFPWHRAIENRYTILRNATGTDAVVPLLPPPPWILLNGEVSNDPADYRNWGNVDYFHLRSLRLQPAHGQPPQPPARPTRPPEDHNPTQ